ncbi:MAG: response regulator transcription factor [Gallionellaceae bacterium]|jgi:DNA-binding NarL/FixJ family response regulator
MKILVADDHDLFRKGMHHVLEQLADHVEILEAFDWQSALTLVTQNPDLAIIDLNMPGMESFSGLDAFLRLAETVPVVVISGSENLVDMRRSLDAGVMGYIAKSEHSPIVLSALRLVLSGGIYVPPKLVQPATAGQANQSHTLPFGLTPRQYEVLQMLLQGKSNKEIAQALILSTITVKAHIGAIFKTLRVDNRAQAIRAVEGVKIDLA